MPIDIIEKINKEIGYKPTFFQMKIVIDKLKNLEYVNTLLYENEIMQKSPIQKEKEATGISNKMTILEENFSNKTDISIETLDILKNIVVFFVALEGYR